MGVLFCDDDRPIRAADPNPLPPEAGLLLLMSGAVTGPYRRTQPITTTWRSRMSCAWSALIIAWRTPRP